MNPGDIVIVNPGTTVSYRFGRSLNGQSWHLLDEGCIFLVIKGPDDFSKVSLLTSHGILRVPCEILAEV